MQAHKMKVTIPENHRLEVRLPEEFPPGPAEVIVLATAPLKGEAAELAKPGPVAEALSPPQRRALDLLETLRGEHLAADEEEVLEQLDAFRREHPFHLSSLAEDE